LPVAVDLSADPALIEVRTPENNLRHSHLALNRFAAGFMVVVERET
jgi:hypothetical protein